MCSLELSVILFRPGLLPQHRHQHPRITLLLTSSLQVLPQAGPGVGGHVVAVEARELKLGRGEAAAHRAAPLAVQPHTAVGRPLVIALRQ